MNEIFKSVKNYYSYNRLIKIGQFTKTIVQQTGMKDETYQPNCTVALGCGKKALT